MTGPYRATGPNPDEPEIEIQPEGDPALPQDEPVVEPGPEEEPVEDDADEDGEV